MPVAILLALAGCAVAISMAAVLRVRRLRRRLDHVALCSHELRGALTAMGLALGRCERAGGAGAARLGLLRDAYERAQSVTRDLEAARGAPAAGSAQRPEAFDLQQVAGRVVEAWNCDLSEHRQPVALDWRAGTALVQGYPMRLSQALHNLVANAVEHGRGRVTVLGRRAGPYVAVSVLDRGAGLDRMAPARSGRAARGPRGHGLVVARHAVELHGGTLRAVRGPLGAGVEIRLPASPSAPAVVSRESPVPAPSGAGAARP
jgi:signal transduction histidine kinase